MFKRILVALDGSEIAEQALPVAARIAKNADCSVMLMQAIDVTAFSYGYVALPTAVGEQPEISEVIESSLNGVRRYLSELAALPIFNDIPIEIFTPFGNASEMILATAESEGVDCIVMTSRGNTGMARWVLGSVAEHVLQHSAVPLLLLRKGSSLAGRPPAEARTLAATDEIPEQAANALVALDGTFEAQHALLPAAYLISALSGPDRGNLHLVRIVLPGNTEKEQKLEVEEAETYLSQVTERLQTQLDKEQDGAHTNKEQASANADKEQTGTNIKTKQDSANGDTKQAGINVEIDWSVLVSPDVVSALIDELGEPEGTAGRQRIANYDMIVLASNDRRGLHRWLLGSVTKGLLTETRIPLFTVKAATGEKKKEKHPSIDQPGATYPGHYIMAVINDTEEAQAAVDELKAAGIPAPHIRLFERPEVGTGSEQRRRTRTIRSRIVDILQSITASDTGHSMIYVEEAIRGHSIINIYAPADEQLKKAQERLAAHHAHTIKFFGRWSISVLHS